MRFVTVADRLEWTIHVHHPQTQKIWYVMVALRARAALARHPKTAE
jgi:hypothetical protein